MPSLSFVIPSKSKGAYRRGVLATAFTVSALINSLVAQIPRPQIGPDEPKIKSLLDSDVVRDQAWAAFWIGKYHLDQLTDFLIESLDRLAKRPSPDSHLASVLLDALVQLDAEVPPDRILPFLKTHPYQVLILISKSPQKNESLFFSLIQGRLPREGWFALCNVLAERTRFHKSTGFAAAMLRDLRIRVTFELRDQTGGTAGDDGLSYRFGPVITVPSDFPPEAVYDFTIPRLESRGAVVLAAGPATIVYTRKLVEPGASYQIPFDLQWNDWMSDSYARLRYVRYLLPYDIKLESWYYRQMAWKNESDYFNTVTALLSQIRDQFNEIIQSLLLYKFLTADEPGKLKPRIELMIEDNRSNKSSLPRIEVE